MPRKLPSLLLAVMLLPTAASAGPAAWNAPGQSLFQSLPPLPPPIPPQPRPALPAGPLAASPGIICRAAIAAAERRYGIPAGLLTAMSLVESGRTNPATGARDPWPWSINAEGSDHVFDTRDQAIAWVRQAQSQGMRSIDTGCLQVNLKHHPNAFPSLEAAFDPNTNADYAARFLVSLHDGPANRDWMAAAGMYHSQTPDLAAAYRQRVQTALGQPTPHVPIMPTIASSGGPSLSNHAERALLLPATTPGRTLDAYRSHPVLLALSNWQRPRKP